MTPPRTVPPDPQRFLSRVARDSISDSGQRQARDRRDSLARPALGLPAHAHCPRALAAPGAPFGAHALAYRPAAIGTQAADSGGIDDSRAHGSSLCRGVPPPAIFIIAPVFPGGTAPRTQWLSQIPYPCTGGRHRSCRCRNEHHDELVEAVKDGELWKLWYTSISRSRQDRAEIDRRLELQERGSMIPLRRHRRIHPCGRGMTTYMHIDAANRRLGDRLDLVSKARAAQRPEHRMQSYCF